MREFGEKPKNNNKTDYEIGFIFIGIAILLVPILYIAYNEYKEYQTNKQMMEAAQQIEREAEKFNRELEEARNKPTAGEIRIYPPNYPEDAIKRGKYGTVPVEIKIGKNGERTAGVVRSGQDRSLEIAAVETAYRANVTPATRNGRNVTTKFQADVIFELEDYPYNTKGIVSIRNVRQVAP